MISEVFVPIYKHKKQRAAKQRHVPQISFQPTLPTSLTGPGFFLFAPHASRTITTTNRFCSYGSGGCTSTICHVFTC